MKIILDNIAFHLQNLGGISVYWNELLKRIINSSNEYMIIENNKVSSNFFRKNITIDNEKIFLEKLPVPISRYLPVKIKTKTTSLMHSSYYRVSQNNNVVNIITVYDFMYEFFQDGPKKYIHSLQKKSAIQKADGIICISNNTKKDLLTMYPETDSEKITAIHLGVDDDYFKIKGHPDLFIDKFKFIKDKYILFVSYRGGYKNFNLVIEVLSALKDYKLILVGGGQLTNEEISILDKYIEGRYFHLLSVNNSDLNILYNFAHCLLYPSSYEGFGIPILEALKSGCPVICSDAASIPEVAGNAGIMINDINKSKIISAINDLKNIEYRNNVIQLGFIHALNFNWDKTYEETINFYNKIYYKRFKQSPFKII